jgi:hypothetical protein
MGGAAIWFFARKMPCRTLVKPLQLLVECGRWVENALFFRRNGRDLGRILAPDPPMPSSRRSPAMAGPGKDRVLGVAVGPITGNGDDAPKRFKGQVFLGGESSSGISPFCKMSWAGPARVWPSSGCAANRRQRSLAKSTASLPKSGIPSPLPGLYAEPGLPVK